jgi:predicted anti-sigma-YlaC factor YlaD
MIISNDGLKELYRGYVRSQTPASREDCPSAKKLLKLLRGRHSEKEKIRVVDHLSHCSHCAEEFEFLLDALRSEKSLIQDVERWLGTKEEAPQRRLFIRRLSWGLASLLAGVAVIGLVIWRFVFFSVPDRFRTNTPATVDLVRPLDQQAGLSSLVFQWKVVSEAEYYVVEVYDAALAPLWKSGALTQSRAVPSEELKEKLVPGHSYFWMVTAILPGRDKVQSPLKEFALKE